MKKQVNLGSAPPTIAVSAALVRTDNWYKELRKANLLHTGEYCHINL